MRMLSAPTDPCKMGRAWNSELVPGVCTWQVATPMPLPGLALFGPGAMSDLSP
jgi:hypothetical protein